MDVRWDLSAACRNTHPRMFFTEDPTGMAYARMVCARCSVRSECLEYALANGEKFGIWGGLSPRERRRILEQRRRAG